MPNVRKAIEKMGTMIDGIYAKRRKPGTCFCVDRQPPYPQKNDLELWSQLDKWEVSFPWYY